MSNILDQVRTIHKQYHSKETDYKTALFGIKNLLKVDSLPMPTSLNANNAVIRLMAMTPGVAWERQAATFIQNLQADIQRRGINL